jgi:hypothetical protein
MLLPRYVDLFGWDRDTLLSEENAYVTWVRGQLAVIEFHGTSNPVAISQPNMAEKPCQRE